MLHYLIMLGIHAENVHIKRNAYELLCTRAGGCEFIKSKRDYVGESEILLIEKILICNQMNSSFYSNEILL